MASAQKDTEQCTPIMPIGEISPYMSKWTIKCRITARAPLRTFARKQGAEGKVFHVELADVHGGEIRASFFDSVAEQFYEVLQVGKVFTFARGTVKVANRQYNFTNCRYELTFDKGCQIVETSGDIAAPPTTFTFVDLRACQTRTLPCRVDLVGVISQARPMGTVMSKTGQELLKRDIVIADDTGSSIKVTLWGEMAKMPDTDFEGTPMVAIKGILLKEWNGGRDGSVSESSVIVLNPDLQEAQRIQKWWSAGGKTQSLVPLGASGGGGADVAARGAQICSVSEMRQKAELVASQIEYYTMPCRLFDVMTRKQGEDLRLHYVACAEQKEGSSWLCNRKVDAAGHCPTCNRAGRTQPRLNMRCRFSDFGDSVWLGTFHESCQQMLSMSGEQVAELDKPGDTEGREKLQEELRKHYFLEPFELKVKAQLQQYNSDIRTSTTVVGCKPVDRRANGRRMLSEISELMAA